MGSTQKMLVYCHLPLDRLYFGVSRNLNEPKYVARRNKIKESYQIQGLRNPLSCGNVKDDGTYQVNRGNNCLAALIELNAETTACVVCCKPNQRQIPQGRQVTVGELGELHLNRISQVHEINAPECFAVALNDAISYWKEV